MQEGTIGCTNHPHVEPAGACDACAELFCAECLVRVGQVPYCRLCKWMAVKVTAGPRRECRDATLALRWAIAASAGSIVCLGIFLTPLAIMKALQARHQIRADRRLDGAWRAGFALGLAILSFGFWAFVAIASALES